MSADAKTWRHLIYLGDVNAFPAFASESDSQRLAGRGGMGYLTSVTLLGNECNCPGFQTQHKCWHVAEAPKALTYWRVRLKLGTMKPDVFDSYFDEWWPRREPIMARCEEGGGFKGKTADEWELWFAALLDERNAREGAYKKLGRTFGGALGAILNGDPPKEGA